MNWRGDVQWRPGHIFHHHRGPIKVRAWRSPRGSHISWQVVLYLPHWQVRFEGNSTTRHPRFGQA